MSTRRRAKGEGCLFRKSDGRWIGVIDLGWSGGRRRRREVSARSRQEAAAKLADLIRERDTGLPVPAGRLTVADLLERWLGSLDVRPTTRRRYEEIARLHVTPALGQVPVSKVTPQHIEELMAAQVAAGGSPRTAMHARSVLRAALHAGMRWGIVARNVAGLAKPLQVPEHEVRPLAEADARAVLAAVAGDRLEALITVALAVGLRQGEALGLRWEDVDLDGGTLAVRRSLIRADGAWLFGEPKTARSRRTVPLPDEVVAALREHRGRQLQERLRAGPLWDGGRWDDLVFTDETGGPLSTFHVGRRFRALIAEAGLPRMRYHDLRHGAASLMAAQGVPVRAAMELLGHSQIATTMNIYAHVPPEVVKEATDRLAAALWTQRAKE